MKAPSENYYFQLEIVPQKKELFFSTGNVLSHLQEKMYATFKYNFQEIS